ncbi:MAG TPA: outer membrane protein transport protein [Parvularculaceae bacterium]|nr:outer membrane protein transport protein [Parvularculaceae bacterium]
MGKTKMVCAGLVALVAAPQAAEASSFAFDHQNARATGAAYAGAQARSGDAGFIYYNPASIAGIQSTEISSNWIVLFGPTRYSDTTATLVGGAPASGRDAGGPVLPTAFVPSSAIAAPINDRIALGIAVYTPYGLRSLYEDDSLLRYHALHSKLVTIAVAPTLAVKLNDYVSVGASLRIEYADLSLSAAIDAGGLAALNTIPGFTPGSSDARAVFSGHDLGFGFTAGLQAKPLDNVTVGFTYSSKITHDLTGDATFGLDQSLAAQILNGATGIFAPTRFSSNLPLPSVFAVGVSIAANERLTLLASTAITRWSQNRQLVINFENPAQPPQIGTQNLSDSWSFSGGAEYLVRPNFTVRAGFMHDQSPSNPAFPTPRIADAPRNWATAGFSFNLSKHMSTDFAAAMVFVKDFTMSRDGTLPEDLLTGAFSTKFSARSYAIASRLRYSF